MYDIAVKQEGCIGARMTGAGFGGCTINIVRNDCVNSFIECVGKGYKDITGIEPKFYVCKTGDGAREIFQ